MPRGSHGKSGTHGAATACLRLAAQLTAPNPLPPVRLVLSCAPAGARQPGQGCEEIEQGIVFADQTPTG